MTHTILIDISAGLIRAALTDETGRLCELCIESQVKDNNADSVVAGAIYKGRVVNVVPSLNAAFVDLGTKSHAILHGVNIPASMLKIHQISGTLRVNNEIMVEVKRPGYAAKGPKVSLDVGLNGRYMVLLPYTNKTFTSQKLPPEERKRLEADSKKLSPRGKILRTEAAQASFAELENEENALINRWREIEAKAQKTSAPCVLYTPDIIWQALENWFDRFDIVEIISNSNAIVQKIKTLYPQFEFCTKLHVPKWNLFSEYNLESQIERAMQTHVTLPSGISLIIETTESMTVIDVNSGKFGSDNFEDTALEANLTAAREIARELQLRCIGGLVVIDFIDMRKTENRTRVLTELRNAMLDDSSKVEIDGFTKTGVVTLKRSRIQRPWQTFYTENHVLCSLGSTFNERYHAHKIYREILDLEPEKNRQNITLKVNPQIAAFFEIAGQPLLMEMQSILQTTICVKPCDTLPKNSYQILQTSPNT